MPLSWTMLEGWATVSAMLKLKRLRVERFRSLVKGTELSFSDGINVVLGQNGTGKTTLLELISMVTRSDFSSLAKEAFAVEYELAAPNADNIIITIRNDQGSTEQIPARKGPGHTLDSILGTGDFFRSSIQVLESSSRQQILEYDTEHGLSVEGKATRGPGGFPTLADVGFLSFLLTSINSKIPRRSFGHHLSHNRNVFRFDESLELFKQITTGDLEGNIYLVSEDWWISDLFLPPFFPPSLIELLRISYRQRQADYRLTNEEWDSLNELKNMMGFKGGEIRIDSIEQPEREGAELKTMQIGNLRFRFSWEDGTTITHERLSYGQKRLLTFYYYLACNSDIVIADELVNGLHHRWITASIEAIGQRQAFLTSQNPLLLDYIPITSAEEVRRSFVLCRGEPREGRPGWIWENMSEEDARELYSAYEVGVEHVSEILQSRGLW